MIDEAVKLLKRKVDSYEIYYAKGSALDLESDHGSIRHIANGNKIGMGLRVIINNRLGSAYTSSLNGIKQCVKNAIATAKVSNPNKHNNFAAAGRYANIEKIDPIVKELNAGHATIFMEDIEDMIKSVSEKLQISASMFSKSHTKSRIVNSEGADIEEEHASVSYSSELLYKDRSISDATAFSLAEKFMLDPGEAKEHAERLLSLIHKEHVKTQTCQVLLKPEALASLLDQSYSFSVSARNIQEKKSIIRPGRKVFDNSITIRDDATTNGLYCTSRCDDEATASRSFNVINKGIFKKALYDLYTASKDNVKSTGNCHRSSFSSTTIMPNNIILMPGTKDDLVEEMDEGIIVEQLLGIRTMSEATGNFSLGVLEGHYVKRGEIQHAVRDTMVAGNFFEMLSKVDAIGKKQKHVVKGSGGMYLPEILCSKIRVIGQG